MLFPRFISSLSTSPETLKTYIYKLQGVSTPESSTRESINDKAPAGAAEKEDDNIMNDEDTEAPFPAVYESGDDFEKANECKMQAADLKSEGKWEEALEKYTEAILAAEPSALLYANRAMVLMELGRTKAAEHDCSLALEKNPDSAKALRIRGKARKLLGKYDEALHDLSASQQIDFDENTVQDLKELSELHLQKEKEEAQKRIEDEEKKRKRAEEIKKAQEEAKKEAEQERARAAASSMGGMSFPFAVSFSNFFFTQFHVFLYNY